MVTQKKLCIAFQTYGSTAWAAGNALFHDLFAALELLGSERPEVVLVKWRNKPESEYGELITHADRIITTSYPPGHPPRASVHAPRTPIGKIARTLRLGQRHAPPSSNDTTFLQQNNIDCSFSVPFEHRTDWSVPQVIVFFDLMYRQHPEWFTPHEVKSRDRTLTRESQRATLLLTYSQSVVADLQEFAPECAPRLCLLRWVSHIPPQVYAEDPGRVVTQYNLPTKFVYLPNHFWQHKNHLLVLDALQVLARRSVFPVVVCTGNLTDQYHPHHINQLMREIATRNQREQFLILGSVPRTDVYALMRQSVCVLNPSQFEGFGMSAAEAHSLGKRVLLSDLPALREQAVPDALYFDPHDAAALAEQLESVWQTGTPGPDIEREAQARALLPTRQAQFAREFVNIMTRATALSRNTAAD